MGFYRGPHVVTDGLVFWLDAANPRSYPGSGTVWNDMSGNNNSGSLTNGPTFSSANNGSIVFDGTNDYVSADKNVFLQLSGISTNFTIELWIYMSYYTAYSDLIGINVSGQVSSVSFKLANGYLSFGDWQIAQSYYTQVTSSVQVPTNQWIQAVFTKLGTVGSLYQNYNIVGSSTITNATITDLSENTGIAGRRTGGVFFPGRISTIRIYNNKALSQAEVKQNYDALKGRYNLI